MALNPFFIFTAFYKAFKVCVHAGKRGLVLSQNFYPGKGGVAEKKEA